MIRGVGLGNGWRQGKRVSSARLALLVLTAAIACGLGPISVAKAEEPPLQLTQFPASPLAGTGAGALDSPRGIATDPATGNVFVAEYNNNRISEWTAWGGFVKAWGWGVKDGAAALQVCTTATGCQKGIAGPESGQLSNPLGISLDSASNVYVVDSGNHRVQKFSAEGEFLLMFGGGVNQTSGGDVCTATSGDICGVGSTGTAAGEFSAWQIASLIAISPADVVYVGDKDRIQSFDSSGNHLSDIATPAPGSSGSLAVDGATGDLYFAFANNGSGLPGEERRPDVYRLDESTGAVLDILPVEYPVALTVDSGGNLYVADRPVVATGSSRYVILKFDSSGDPLIERSAAFGAPPDQTTRITGIAPNTGCEPPTDDLYVTYFRGGTPEESYVRAYGPAPQNVVKCPQPQEPPRINSQFLLSSGAEDAVLSARINPRFWSDTRYYVEYGAAPCSTGGCPDQQPVPPGLLLTSAIENASLATEDIELKGLQPNTSYFFRFVASSSGGGPVFGVDPDGEGPESATFEDGLEGTFLTEGAESSPQVCANAQFRTGIAANLPDCRAYEMVSPVDKNGGNIATGNSARGYPSTFEQSSADGNSLTYSSATAFADAVSGPWSSQYIATRDSTAGWITHAISAPIGSPIFSGGAGLTVKLDSAYKAFSADLSDGWFVQSANPVLDGCGAEGFVNLYRRDNDTGAYEALTTAAPSNQAPQDYVAEPLGFSADGSHAVFRANGKLTSDAADITGNQLYEHIAGPGCGELRLVSVLPDDEPSDQPSIAGYEINQVLPESRENLVMNAISDDGSRIFWTTGPFGGPYSFYVRINGTETVKIIDGGVFQMASADGSHVILALEGGQLFDFNVDTKVPVEIGKNVLGTVGGSEDASRFYFVSTDSVGGQGKAGSPNLYLYQRDVGTKFVATLSSDDVSINAPFSVNNPRPARRANRISPDGRFLVFLSNQPLTGYDNADATTGKPDLEVYRYDSVSGDLSCLSCRASNARPEGREISGFNSFKFGVAAQIPAWQTQFYASRALLDDGSRVFFESFDDLVPRDTNGRMDVYQWEQAGTGSCDESDRTFSAASGGCVELISAGSGDTDSNFVDASPSGSDVFFKTDRGLVAQDPGLIDIYAARVDGGFPPPSPRRQDCEDESGCLPAPTPSPPAGQPGSGNPGPGNPAVKPPCPKGKRPIVRAGKVRCVKKGKKQRKHKHHRHGGRSRGAGR
jgi:hypothetical protein